MSAIRSLGFDSRCMLLLITAAGFLASCLINPGQYVCCLISDLSDLGRGTKGFHLALWKLLPSFIWGGRVLQLISCLLSTKIQDESSLTNVMTLMVCVCRRIYLQRWTVNLGSTARVRS